VRYVYDLNEPAPDGKPLLGSKGAGLAQMTALGLPVPPGFVVTTEACRAYVKAGGAPDGLLDEVEEHVERLQKATGRRFGHPRNPLLVSVRSGAPVSMPGMMDTILNLGLNDASVLGLAASTRNPRFAWDCYRRLIQMFGEVVMRVPGSTFEEALTDLKARRGVTLDTELDAFDLEELVDTFKALVSEATGETFPQDPHRQLEQAILAVFDSWQTPRAKVYRELNSIPDNLGTAVNVITMVFGNRGETSATGVCFTRDPATGEHQPFGEFLQNAQGEDVVAGIRTPEPLEELHDLFPAAFDELVEDMHVLETYYHDVQDIEFTIEDGHLYLLQTRSAKRTAAAALKTAVEMVDEGLISRADAIRRIDPAQLDQLLHPGLDPEADVEVIAVGLAASPGAACGAAVFDADTAAALGAGEPVLLIRPETTPDDIHGMAKAQGILTARGGMTSHASVVARGMGIPCITGCDALEIDLETKTLRVGEHVVHEGDLLTIDGSTGRVVLGAVPLVPPQVNADFETILGWADDIRLLGVRANADTPEDAAKARELGAEGIGLCRTEHMFMAQERLPVVHEMILADDTEGRGRALAKLLPFQQADFEGIFEAMEGLPVTIRLLDPPLHEFLPSLEEATDAKVRERILQLQEANPMLGTRGCRLGLLYPEIYEMQVRAIVRAAAAVRERTAIAPKVEIMHPLVGFAEELRRLRRLTEEVFRQEEAEPTPIGTMIELPRACVQAHEIAEYADFFSFGTNDLTQTALGVSRDDAEGKFLAHYVSEDILADNPFETLDRDGVGKLMRLAVRGGRVTKPGLKTGICGEHGGDPRSIAFCHDIGLDYVSCSPFRVPLARLAAAQAALAERAGQVGRRERELERK
jgi:pyruvate,orthophosphate dikinase